MTTSATNRSGTSLHVLLLAPLLIQGCAVASEAALQEGDSYFGTGLATFSAPIAMPSALAPGASVRLQAGGFDFLGVTESSHRYVSQNTEGAITVISGKGVTQREGEFSLAEHNGIVIGTIYEGDAIHEIAFDPVENRSYLRRIDPSSLRDGCEAELSFGPNSLPTSAFTKPSALTPQTEPIPVDLLSATQVQAAPYEPVDISFLYTEQSLEAAGGFSALAAKIAMAVDHTNEAIRESLPGSPVLSDTPIRLHGMWQIELDESDLDDTVEDAFDWLKSANRAENFLQDLSSDMIQLVVSHASGPNAGKAKLAIRQDRADPDKMFSVSSLNHFGTYVPTHEIGHNLGAQHNYEDANGQGAFIYSHGFRVTVGDVKFRTIMSYKPDGSIIRRLRRFSNPHLRYENYPLGSDRAQNAATIIQTLPIAASFR